MFCVPVAMFLAWRRTLVLLHLDGRAGPLVDGEREDVGSCVVADDIQIELGARDLIEVDLCDQNVLAVPEGPSKHVTEWSDDAASAETDWVIRIGRQLISYLGWKVAQAGELVTGQNEASALPCDVTHRR